jgi:apolipoprotein N-acyltransferase
MPHFKSFWRFRSFPGLRLLILFGSGALMALSGAPVNAFPLAWLALVPLWVMGLGFQTSSTSKPFLPDRLRANLPALTWGVAYHGLALSWVLGLHPLTWMGIPWLGSVAIALSCWVFITLWGAALVIVWAWLMRRLASPQTNPYLRVLLGTALWCSLESIWSLGSLYWTSLSFTQSPGNLVVLHLGRLAGPLTVTAAIVAVNGLLAEAWLAGREWWRRGGESRTENLELGVRSPRFLGVSAGILLLVSHMVGFWLYQQPLEQPEAMGLKVGIVQGNVPTRIKLFSEGLRLAEERYTSGYEGLAQQGVNAVLTPEGALPILWNRPTSAPNPFLQAILNQKVVAWLGTFTAQRGGIARSLLTIAGDGAVISQYDKIKLVPLGEYVPFQNILGGIIGQLTPISEDGVPGSLGQHLDTPFGQAIGGICYDSAFPEIFRSQAAAGGEFILTASNLDPYSQVLMAQHQAQDLMRAIETDRWAARATNTGYSSFIDPHGHILWRSQPHAYETYAAILYRRQSQTPYVRWGNWLTPLLLFLGGAGWLVEWQFNRHLHR